MAGKKKKCTTSFQRSGTFPFMQLPPEIRNMVYRYLSICPGRIGAKRTKTRGWMNQYNAYRQLDFGRTCRQIYEEHKSIFFSENGFEFYYVATFVTFIEGIGISGRQLLKELRWNQKDVSAFTALRYLRSCQNLKRLDIAVLRYSDHPISDMCNALDCFVLKTMEKSQRVRFRMPVTNPGLDYRLHSNILHLKFAYQKIQREQRRARMS